MADPATVIVAALTALAAAYCLVRCLVPRFRGHHRVAMDAWHVLMGGAMVVMLAGGLAAAPALGGAALFGAGALWFTCEAWILRRTAHLRLAAASTVMTGMLLPLAWGAPAGAAASDVMPGMASGSGGAGTPTWLAGALLTGAALLALGAVAAGVRARERGLRTSAVCELVMAAAMGYMALLAF